MSFAQKNEPILSVCIPAFGFEKGVIRILERLKDINNIEIIVSEDPSKSPLDYDRITSYPNTIMHTNRVAEGAISNWNRALSKASGKYVWLLHHDEEPIFPYGADAFIDTLGSSGSNTIYISNLMLDNGLWQKFFRTNFVRKILSLFPNIILVQNYIGSPSNLIIPRELNLTYNENLKYLVDVDFYRRMLIKSKLTIHYSAFDMISHRYSESITASLKGNITKLSNKEFELICEDNKITFLVKLLWNVKQCLKLISGRE